MSYCINPECQNRLNLNKQDFCQSCGTSLLIQGRYRLVKPLRKLDSRHHTELWEVDDRGVAKVLKVLKDDSPKLVELFTTEVMVLQYLKHPGIPQVEIEGNFTFIPHNHPQELHCLVMEKIPGENLEDWIKNHGQISQNNAISWLKEITKTLGYLHENGLFHRDIKPSNIMLTPEGQLVLIDFGSAREISYTYLAKLQENSKYTEIISSGYTPVEQINGKAVPQSDFYALGRTFVYLLTGTSLNQLPVNDKNGQLIWRNKAPHISGWFADLIDDMMATFPGKRPQTAQIILERLEPSKFFMLPLSRLSKAQKIGLAFMGTLPIIALISFQFVLPEIAKFLNEKGYENFENGQLTNAEVFFQWALKINPKSSAARYNLATVCEQKKDIECALTQYKKVMQDNSDDVVSAAAISKLSRFYINDGKNLDAIELLTQALQKTDDFNVKSALYRNLGWAFFNLKSYRKAQSYLETAIKLSSDRASNYCLLAQVQEAQGNKQAAIKLWRECLNKADEQNPDEFAWKALANQRLNAICRTSTSAVSFPCPK